MKQLLLVNAVILLFSLTFLSTLPLQAKQNLAERGLSGVSKNLNDQLLSGNMNNDGFDDIIVFNPSNGSFSVSINNANLSTINSGSSGFNSSTILNSFGGNTQILIDDVDNDGLDYVILFNETLFSINIYLNTIGGISTTPVSATPNPIPTGNFKLYKWNNGNPINSYDLLLYNSVSGSLIKCNFLPIVSQPITYSTFPIGTNFDELLIDNFNTLSASDEIVGLRSSTNELFQYSYNGTFVATLPMTLSGLPNSLKLFKGHFTNPNINDLIVFNKVTNEIKKIDNTNGTFSIGATMHTPLNNTATVDDFILRSNQANQYDVSFKLMVDDYSGDGLTDVMFYETKDIGTVSYFYFWLGFNMTNPNHQFKFNRWSINSGSSGGVAIPDNMNWQFSNADFNNDNRPDILMNKLGYQDILIQYNNPLLEGYCWPLSATAGSNTDIKFYFSGNGKSQIEFVKVYVDIAQTTGNPFDPLISNYSQTSEISKSIITLPDQPKAQYISDMAWRNGCDWDESYSLTIPNNWASGYYAVKITSQNDFVSYIPFIIKANAQSCKNIVAIANTNTWQAYNGWSNAFGENYGRTNGNIDYPVSESGRGKYIPYNNGAGFSTFSFKRPNPWASPVIIPGTNSETINHQEALCKGELYIYSWLEYNGYNPSLVCDQDLHENNFNLNAYKTFVMGTHPEYWTKQMYDNLADFQKNGAGLHGGNTVSIGGNSIYEKCDLLIGTGSIDQIQFYDGYDKFQPNGRHAFLFSRYEFDANAPNGLGYPQTTPIYLYTYDPTTWIIDPYSTGSHPEWNLISVTTDFKNNPGGACTSTSASLTFDSPLNVDVAFLKANFPTNTTTIGLSNANPSCGDFPLLSYQAIHHEADSPVPWGKYSPTQSSTDFYRTVLASTPLTTGLTPYAELIYIPPYASTPNNHGYIFSGGAISFGGSLATDVGIQQLMKNVLSEISVSTTNVTCSNTNNGTITISSNVGNSSYTYSITPSAGINQNGGIFTSVPPNTYTITATDAIGCSISKVVIVNGPQASHCCSPTAETLVANPNVILLSNPTATDIITTYNNAISIVYNKTFYIDGVLTIDDDITFDNCTLYFTPNSSIQMTGATTLNASNSTLQASCDWWGGIVAQNAANKVSMNSGSTIKNSSWGIHAMNNAIIEIDDAHFVDNGAGCISLSNMTLNPYPGFIKNSTFTSQANLPSPWNKTEFAINLSNVKHIKIGGLNQGNTFDGMRTGIFMVENGSGTSANNLIEIEYNSFSNIHADDLTNGVYFSQETAINATCYTQYQGSAIHAYYNAVPTFQGYLNATANTISQCDKGIVNLNSNLIIQNNTLTNCQLGFMSSVPLKRRIYAVNNTMTNTHLGIEILGRPRDCNIVSNSISSGFGVLTGVGPVQKNAPIGIKITYNEQSTMPGINYYVANNTVKLNSIAGIGIYNIWGDAGMKNEMNNIEFLTNSTTPASYEGFNTKSLWGIWNDACWMSTFEENTTIGNSTSDPTYWNNRDTKGMYFAESEDCNITCNKAKYTRFGFLAKGKNETDKTNVKFNKFNANAFPWFFIDGAETGSFGDVGAFGDDGRNEFLYAGGGGAINRLFDNVTKVFTNTSNTVTQPNFIYTDWNMLHQSEIKPDFGFAYKWEDAFQGLIYTDPCNPDPNFIANPDDGGGTVNLGDELVVDIITATNQNNYLNFSDVATYIDQKKLYKKLDENINYRNSNASLLTFYNSMNQSTLGQIVESEKAIELLTQNNLTRTQYESLLTDAITKNNNIVANYNWEVNERNINAQTIQWINKGIDSIESAERASIEMLAKSCVFIDGPAVYKARAIHSNFEPDAIYDDRVLCITTQNKGGSGTTDVDSLMLVNTGWGNNFEVQPIKQNEQIEVGIYPNPINNSVFKLTHTCTSKGMFVLYNMLGQELIRTQINSGENKITLPDLANGIYNYRCEFENCSWMNGKLKIIK